jgi:hypothetical protein
VRGSPADRLRGSVQSVAVCPGNRDRSGDDLRNTFLRQEDVGVRACSYETVPMTPAFSSGFVNWRSGAQHLERMQELKNMLCVAIIVRDKGPGGTVKIGRDGEPIASYVLSPGDTELLMKGFEGAARIAEAAGATKLFTTHHRTLSYEPGRGRSIDSFIGETRKRGAAPASLSLASLHIMGSARGRCAAHVRTEPGRRDVGREEPRGRGRILSPDRVGSEPDDLDRVDRI